MLWICPLVSPGDKRRLKLSGQSDVTRAFKMWDFCPLWVSISNPWILRTTTRTTESIRQDKISAIGPGLGIACLRPRQLYRPDEVKWSESRSVLSASLRSHGLYSPWNSQARILEWVAVPFSRGSSNPGIEPRSPTLQVYPLPAKPQKNPKNTGVGSLSLLQWTFPTQESKQCLLHCRQILYQLRYQGSPLPVLYI